MFKKNDSKFQIKQTPISLKKKPTMTQLKSMFEVECSAK